ncbi:MAG: hypothetical protein GY806_22910 [Gammaproteobacteria bacterium]|nr:hypothetical protein [Gammaproteobacteria bacterium]
MNKELETFTLFRKSDHGGVSGEGRVLDGTIFHNGWVVVCWRTDIEGSGHGHSSIAMYPSWESFEFLHIKAHPENKSVVVFGDDVNLKDKLDENLIPS